MTHDHCTLQCSIWELSTVSGGIETVRPHGGMADHLASRSRSRSRSPSRRGTSDAAQPAQQAVGNEGQQHTNVAIWSLDDAARLIAVLRQSERQGRMSHTTVCRLQGPPPSLTLTVNLPQTSQIVDRALSGAQFAETGESEHGGSDDVEVEPEPESMIAALDVQRLWHMMQRLQSYVQYLDRWSWRTWQECRKLRNRIAVLEGVNTNPPPPPPQP